jgi:hypothetical protein
MVLSDPKLNGLGNEAKASPVFRARYVPSVELFLKVTDAGF